MTVLLKSADGVHSYDDLEQAQSKRAEIGGELFVPMADWQKLADKLEFLRGKGLTVGMAKDSGKPPYLAYVIEPGSELSDDKAISDLVDAQIDMIHAQSARDELLAFAKNIASNYNCDEWSHMQSSRCRKCDAEALLRKFTTTPAGTSQSQG